jgi:hypothetical protein
VSRTRSSAAFLLAAALLVGSCGGDDSCSGGTGCGEPCATGNALGVGKFCTAGGGECNGLDAAFCTVDFDSAASAFCTRPCDPTGDVAAMCGEGARCDDGGTGQFGCVPESCFQ